MRSGGSMAYETKLCEFCLAAHVCWLLAAHDMTRISIITVSLERVNGSMKIVFNLSYSSQLLSFPPWFFCICFQERKLNDRSFPEDELNFWSTLRVLPRLLLVNGPVLPVLGIFLTRRPLTFYMKYSLSFRRSMSSSSRHSLE